jgi:phytoene synthase
MDGKNLAAAGISDPVLSAMAAFLRRHDPDRFFCTLFAPAEKREALFTLYAFNHELTRAREAAAEPGLALIRLEWWREVVEGETRAHEVAAPLAALLKDGVLDRAALLAMIAAREAECQPAIETEAEWRRYLHGRGGVLAVEAGRVLGAQDREYLAKLGAAYTAAGLLRSSGQMAARGRWLLPKNLLPREAPVAAATALAGKILRELGPKRDLGDAVAAGLIGVLARHDLARADRPPVPRGIGIRLAVIWAALRGRV